MLYAKQPAPKWLPVMRGVMVPDIRDVMALARTLFRQL